MTTAVYVYWCQIHGNISMEFHIDNLKAALHSVATEDAFIPCASIGTGHQMRTVAF